MLDLLKNMVFNEISFLIFPPFSGPLMQGLIPIGAKLLVECGLTKTILRIHKEKNPYEITHQSELLLFNEQPLVIRPTLACLIGLNEAIVLQQVHYWITINTKAERNLRDGYYWTFNSVANWQKQFPFWSYETIKRTLNKLSGKIKGKPKPPKLLITANYNNIKIDRTLWYRIDYDLLGIIAKEANEFPLGQNDPMQKVRLTQPIPETTTKNMDDPLYEYHQYQNQTHNQAIKQDVINAYGTQAWTEDMKEH